MLKRLIRKWLGLDSKTPTPKDPDKKKMKVTSAMLARNLKPEEIVEFEAAKPPDGVVPANAKLAMDSTPYTYINNGYVTNYWQGYPALAMLAQLPEYRKLSSEISKAMTRKWIRITSKGEDDKDDKADKISKLIDAMERFKVKDLFKEAAEHDGLFGRGQLFIDIKSPKGTLAQDDPDELQTPLLIHKAKIKQDSLVAFRLVEPVWTYPSAYNASNPLAADFYKPSTWYVMGKTVHSSRLLMFISRPMPDLLKAAYSFGGLSMSQLAQPYIQNWIRTRDSVSDLVHAFSVTGLKTDMSTILEGDGSNDEDFLNRATLFTQMRDNRGLMVCDKDNEEFFQMNTPLGTLDSLQQQAQEQMASVSNMPLIVLLGITPSGLNTSSEGELQVWNDYVAGLQESIFTENLNKVMDILQLNEFGTIDQDITYEFEPMEEMSEEQIATINKTKADTDVAYIGAGVIAPEETREKLAGDVLSGYNTIDVSDVPEPPDMGGFGDEPDDDPEGKEKPNEQASDELANDIRFNENDHPRDKEGKFGSGGGGGSTVVSGSEKAAKEKRDRQQNEKYGYVDAKGNIRSGGLNKEQRLIEGAFHHMIDENTPQMIEQYIKTYGRTVDPDLAKSFNSEFAENPDLAAAVHEPSSKLSKAIWQHCLEEKAANGDDSPIIFTAGGSGSGKSETLKVAKVRYNAKQDGMVADGVLSNPKKAIRKIDETLAAQKGEVVVAYTNRPIEDAFIHNLRRERTVKIFTFASAHAGAAGTVKDLTEHYKDNPRVKINVINNFGGVNDIKEGTVADVPTYDKETLIQDLTDLAKHYLDSGEVWTSGKKKGKPIVDQAIFEHLTTGGGE